MLEAAAVAFGFDFVSACSFLSIIQQVDIMIKEERKQTTNLCVFILFRDKNKLREFFSENVQMYATREYIQVQVHYLAL